MAQEQDKKNSDLRIWALDDSLLDGEPEELRLIGDRLEPVL